MKSIQFPATACILFFLLTSPSNAQIETSKEMTVVVPAESIAKFIAPLLPYKIELGQNFKGSFWIKCIENIKIIKNKISFSSHIHGKDIEYVTKMGSRTASFVVGDVNLRSQWQASFNYDKNQKKLFIKPQIEDLKDTKELSQGDLLLNALFNALSDIEYPIEINKLKPVKLEVDGKVLTINMEISDIYADNNRLFIEVIPTPQIEDSKRQL